MKTMIDFRSDTVTLPTQEMRDAMYKCEVGDDVLREDPTINELEEYSASLLGKEAALFVPSGTFGNQCAILTHTKSSDEVLLCEDAHIVQHEVGASALLSRVQLRAVAPKNGKFLTAEEVAPKIRAGGDIHYPDTGLICLEQATATGNLYPLEAMKEIYELAKKHKIPVHIDGARFYNAAVAMKREPKELAWFADSISFCLSKGLCAPVGSVIVGEARLIERARKHRKLMGGGMRQAGFLAAAGLVALKKMRDRLEEDHQNAKLLAELLVQVKGVTLTKTPEINMVFLKLEKQKVSDEAVVKNFAEHDFKIYPPENGEYRFVTHYGISSADIKSFAKVFREIMH